MSSEQTIERIQKAIKKAFEKDPAYEGMEIEFYDFKVRNPVSTNIEVGIVQIGTFKYDIALFVPKYECSAREYVVDSLREEFPNNKEVLITDGKFLDKILLITISKYK